MTLRHDSRVSPTRPLPDPPSLAGSSYPPGGFGLTQVNLNQEVTMALLDRVVDLPSPRLLAPLLCEVGDPEGRERGGDCDRIENVHHRVGEHVRAGRERVSTEERSTKQSARPSKR
jgi:hypothetical protein